MDRPSIFFLSISEQRFSTSEVLPQDGHHARTTRNEQICSSVVRTSDLRELVALSSFLFQIQTQLSSGPDLS